MAWGFEHPQQVPKKRVASRTMAEAKTCGPGASPCPPLATLECTDRVEPGERRAGVILIAAAISRSSSAGPAVNWSAVT